MSGLPDGSFGALAGRIERLEELLRQADEPALTAAQAQGFTEYLFLLMRWNAKMNLTAIRDEENILRRHFFESIFCARLLPPELRTLLDYGSGAGFPGVPCALCRSDLQVTLAESQAKKASFLREVVRSLHLTAVVYEGRVEDLPAASLFDAVTLRAVDKMGHACMVALSRVKPGGWLILFATRKGLEGRMQTVPELHWHPPKPIPGSEQEVLLLGQRS